MSDTAVLYWAAECCRQHLDPEGRNETMLLFLLEPDQVIASCRGLDEPSAARRCLELALQVDQDGAPHA